MLKDWLIGVASMAATSLLAQNPVICDRYTPDPAPYVHGDTLYLFVDHDEDQTLNNYFTMKDWLLYSTVDMVNWTYRGTPLTSATFSAWAKQDNDCWASQCIEYTSFKQSFASCCSDYCRHHGVSISFYCF